MPRKTRPRQPGRAAGRGASMRPRPDAAENILVRDGHHAAGGGASMRPRPDAAENGGGRGRSEEREASFNEAAARCRGKRRDGRLLPLGHRGFNEAAARCRGKHRLRPAGPLPGLRASMRPRPDAAENARPGVGAAGRGRASMRPRPDAAENGDAPCRRATRYTRFNEAAARCRGKLFRGDPDPVDRLYASMRPRPDAAENLDRPAVHPPRRWLQ